MRRSTDVQWRWGAAVFAMTLLTRSPGELMDGHRKEWTQRDSTDLERVWAALDGRYFDTSYAGAGRQRLRAAFDSATAGGGAHDRDGIVGLIAILHDPNTRLLTRERFAALREETTGEPHVGVGLPELLGIDVDNSGDRFVVVSPQPGSPAARAGLRPRDVVARIGDRATSGLSLQDVAATLRGSRGTSVDVTIVREGDTLHRSLTRALLETKGDGVSFRVIAGEVSVAYIRVSSFTSHTVEGVERVLTSTRSSHVGRYVIDLRANPGGDLSVARRVAGLFLGNAAIARSVSRGRADTLRSIGPRAASGRMAVLIDGGTASAAELLAIALRDIGRATLVGRRTFGKGLVHSILGLKDGSVLVFTVARLQTLAGHDLLDEGVAPDVAADGSDEIPLIHAERAGTRADRDLWRAISRLDIRASRRASIERRGNGRTLIDAGLRGTAASE